MQQKVIQFMRSHQMLKQGTTILIGVSGGPDSVALLHLYKQIRDKYALKIIALSVDHQLRGEDSAADTIFVQSICSKWGIPFYTKKVDVVSYKEERKVGTQVAARELRYAYFKEQCQEHQADYLALGHHGDDQVETMLMNFIRSSNPGALAGIPFVRPFPPSQIIRPLLCVSKQEILSYCEQERIDYRIDASNEETDYTRNYFRKVIIPLIKERRENIHVQVQQLSEHLIEDEAYLIAEANKVIEHTVVKREKGKEMKLEVAKFKKYSRALQRRAYHLILSYLYRDLPKNLSVTHEKSFFELFDRTGYRTLDFPQGLIIEKSYEYVRLSFEESTRARAFYHEITKIPSNVVVDNRMVVKIEYEKCVQKVNQTTLYLPADRVKLPLAIRYREPGDRMSWSGFSGSKKVQRLFIDAKIDVNDRDNWPLLVDGENNILWLIGLKKGSMIDIQTDDSELYIKVTYEHLDV